MIKNEHIKNRVVVALILSVIIILSSLFSVIFMLDPAFQSKIFLGVENFKYFTVINNFLGSLVVMLTVPFEIEGIRKHNYHLPRWIVNILFFIVGNMVMIFLFTSTVMSFSIGVKKALFGKFNFWQHLLSPILCMILFFLVDKDHEIKFKTSIFCMIPNVIYFVVYVIFAIYLKDSPYAWPDVYHLAKFGHTEIMLTVSLLGLFLLINLVRLLHNLQHKRYGKALENYYLNSENFKDKTIEEIIKTIALKQKELYVSGDIEIPVHILRYYLNKDGNKLSLDEMCQLYTKYYFK